MFSTPLTFHWINTPRAEGETNTMTNWSNFKSIITYYQSSEPPTPEIGEVWYEVPTDSLYV